jgi:hypothetical protein
MKLPLSISFRQIQTIGTIIAMATTAPQVLDLMNALAAASEEHVEEIIKALKALPQCIEASAEATKMSSTKGAEDSTLRKSAPSKSMERRKKRVPPSPSRHIHLIGRSNLQYSQSLATTCSGTLLSPPEQKVSRSALNH